MNLLLLSNSSAFGKGYFSFAKDHVARFVVKQSKQRILFIPYATTGSYQEYTETVGKQLNGLEVDDIHSFKNKIDAVKQAEAIMIGGGNTFALVAKLHELNLIEAIREKVIDGTPYIGWSAGSNMACPTIMTTNDMPIVEPESFSALNLVKFQINPHYTEKTIKGHNGESRKQRLMEYLDLNPGKTIVALPEGTYLEAMGSQIIFHGKENGKILTTDSEYSITDKTEISSYLNH